MWLVEVLRQALIEFGGNVTSCSFQGPMLFTATVAQPSLGQEGGAAAKWNAGHPDRLIEPGHLIVKVNDKDLPLGLREQLSVW